MGLDAIWPPWKMAALEQHPAAWDAQIPELISTEDGGKGNGEQNMKSIWKKIDETEVTHSGPRLLFSR